MQLVVASKKANTPACGALLAAVHGSRRGGALFFSHKSQWNKAGEFRDKASAAFAPHNVTFDCMATIDFILFSLNTGLSLISPIQRYYNVDDVKGITPAFLSFSSVTNMQVQLCWQLTSWLLITKTSSKSVLTGIQISTHRNPNQYSPESKSIAGYNQGFQSC